MRTISTSKGCRSFRSMDWGLRPNASETPLPAPANLPLGEDQVSSARWLVFIFSMMIGPYGHDPHSCAKAAIDVKRRAGDERRVRAGEKSDRRRDFLGPAIPAKRRPRFLHLREIP